MTITSSMGFSPKWYEPDLIGLPLAGGFLASFSSLNHSQFQAIYVDQGLTEPYAYLPIPNQMGKTGISFDENGTQGPFWFAFDSTNPSNLYYLELYDANGVLQWTIDNYLPGGTGGSVVTSDVNIQNLVANNAFYRNVGNGLSTIVPGTFQVIAPGANAGLALTAQNYGPDICFIKSDTSATDTYSFPLFALGGTSLPTDVTPVNYFNYTCTVAGTESFKYLQFPITQGVNNLAGQTVSVSVWARINSGASNTLQAQFVQYFGEGTGASSVQLTSVFSLPMSATWQKLTANGVVISSLTGKSIGSPPTGNDGIFLQILLPLDEICSIDIVKPSVYLGSLLPVSDFATNDMVDSLINTPRTGDVKTSIRTSIDGGWIRMDDGTIGNLSSNAITTGSTFTFPLFSLLWSMNSTYVPMYTSSGVLQARGASAVADYVANYAISLPKTLGQVLAGSSPYTLTSASLAGPQAFTVNTGVSTSNLNLSGPLSATAFGTGNPITLQTTGALPSGLVANAVYYSIFINNTTIQVATSIANALAGTPLTFSDNGSGTNTVQLINNTLGFFEGANFNTLTSAELPQANLFTAGGAQVGQNSGGAGPNAEIVLTSGSATPSLFYTTGNVSPAAFNILQPTTYINYFIKL